MSPSRSDDPVFGPDGCTMSVMGAAAQRRAGRFVWPGPAYVQLPAGPHVAGLQELAERQAGVLQRDQAYALGLSFERIDAQLAARRWAEAGPLIVVLHNGPLTLLQQMWVAVLNAGPRAALCGRTAAALHGLEGWDDCHIHLVVPRGERPPDLPGVPVQLHESRRFDPDRDVAANRQPPRTGVERSLIDAAAWTASPRGACGLLVAGVQQRLTVAGRLLGVLGRVGQVRHRAMMRRTLWDVEGGARALSELDFNGFCRRRMLPIAERQGVRLDRFGRRRYVDAVMIGPGGTRVSIEIDGAVHLQVGSYWDDCSRANELVIAGESLLRFPTVAFYVDGDRVADQLRRALGRAA